MNGWCRYYVSTTRHSSPPSAKTGIKEGKECPSDGGLPTGGRDRKGFESDTKTITFVSNSKINANRVLVILEALGTDKVAA